MADLFDLVCSCDDYLEVHKSSQGGAPDGWQVLGRRQVGKLASRRGASAEP